MESNEINQEAQNVQPANTGAGWGTSNPSSDRDEAMMRAVGRVLKINSVTWGGQKQDYLAKFVGRLYTEDTPAAYDKLAAELQPLEITPLFRWEGNDHAVILKQSVPKPKPGKNWVNLLLFILTLLSLLFTGGLYGMGENIPTDTGELILAFITKGWPFALCMIAILGTHELGHYFMGRKHGVNVSLPYFIPFPGNGFGTLGAFISMREMPRNRRQLLDIGVTGPLAGLIVTIPVLLIGLHLSNLNVLPAVSPTDVQLQMEGNSILYLLAKYISFGKLLPEPASLNGVPEALYWIKYFFTGKPFPYGGTDVMLNSVAWAGWVGMFVTGLNLLPIGQLDGGHVFSVLLGSKWAKKIYPVILVAMIGLGFFWNGWWLWAAILFLFGRYNAEPLDMITTLDSKRKVIAVIGLIVFVITFIPVPLILM